jgi:hypothetical protein
LPVVDQLAAEYQDRVDFVAVAWKSSFDATAARAAELMPSGAIKWGLDESEGIFAAYGVPYQPVTVLVAGGVEVNRWPGALSAEEIRAELDTLVALTG